MSKAPRSLQISYKLDGTAVEYMEANKPYAEPIAQTHGPIAAEVKNDPTASFKDFDVPRLSAVTRAPMR